MNLWFSVIYRLSMKETSRKVQLQARKSCHGDMRFIFFSRVDSAFYLTLACAQAHVWGHYTSGESRETCAFETPNMNLLGSQAKLT